MIYATDNYAIVSRVTGRVKLEVYGNVDDIFRTYNVHPDGAYAVLPFITYLEQYNLAVKKAEGSEPDMIGLVRFYLNPDNRARQPYHKHVRG